MFGAALPVLAHESDHNRARGRRLYRTLDRAIGIFAVAATAILIAFPEPILRLTYRSSFTGAASALRWTGIALLPLLTNASRRVYPYARGDEVAATRWTIAALAIQIVAAATIESARDHPRDAHRKGVYRNGEPAQPCAEQHGLFTSVRKTSAFEPL